MKKETRLLLRERAVELANEPEQTMVISTLAEIIEFKLSGESYGIESVFVREVFKLTDLTFLPGVPSYILGIVNVHGQILPVMDLKIFFNLPVNGLSELNKVIILSNDQMEFGILADEIIRTCLISREELFPVPVTITGIGERYLKGVTKGQLIILSAENLLLDSNIVINEEVSQ
jgi:purine-binding chemotaxis protein CheW